jgi:hypothetical protein
MPLLITTALLLLLPLLSLLLASVDQWQSPLVGCSKMGQDSAGGCGSSGRRLRWSWGKRDSMLQMFCP